MLKNYLKSALLFIKHNRVFAGINLMGLAIALAASFIMLLYVINELSYNSCHKNRSKVYTVLSYNVNFKRTFARSPYVLATALKEQFPQVEKAIRVGSIRGFSLKFKEEIIAVNDAVATDSEVFDIFTLPLIAGPSNKNLLDDQNSIVLSRDLAEKVFPGQNPIGKEIVGMINNSEQVLVVKGVFENIPENSTITAQCFLNSKWTLEPINKNFKITNADKDWTKNYWTTWILLSKDCNPKMLENQFRAFEIKNMGEKPAFQFSLQNLGDVYLGSSDIVYAGMTGNKKNVKLFSAIAFLILLVASLNYIILSTAISTGRGLEVGLRKTFGAANRNIKYQLLSESIFLALIVLPIALVLMRIALPYAGKLFQTNLNIISSNIIVYICVYLALTIIIGLISGFYTSSYLARLKVIDIFKNSTGSGKGKQYFRSFLIILQLIIFCSFVSATIIIRSQYLYIRNKDLGYYNKDILMIGIGQNFKGYSAFSNNIKSNPNVIMVSGSWEGLPLLSSSTFMVPHFLDKQAKVQVEGLYIDYNFFKTMGISLSDGRDFSLDYGSDLIQSTILNETAVKSLGIIDPVGKLIGKKTIIGIVKDFNLHSLHSNIPPLQIFLSEETIRQVIVHYKSGSLKAILPMIEAEWKKVAPDRPFRYSTIEELINKLYASAKNLSTIISIFAFFTLLIASLGLFGLTLFVARSRTMEIGIKKAFGHSERSIIFSFLSINLILVFVANILSIPVTLYFMTKWLNNFAYRTTINWWVFLISFILSAIVVLLTVFFHSYKASHINPVKALKHE